MLKRLSSLFLVLLLFVGSQTFFSCDMNDDESGSVINTGLASLSGYWKTSYGDGFELSSTSLKVYDDASKSLSFAGTVVNDPDLTSASSYLIVKITDPGNWGMSTDKYYAVYLKEYTGTTVRGASAYKAGSSYNYGIGTQSAAESEYTVANGYYTYFSDYVKQ